MKKTLTILMCMTLLFAAIIPMTAMANAASMFVYTSNHKTLNMRSSMVTGANNVVAHVPYGAEIDVLQLVNSTWAKCQYNNQVGYCMRRYLVTSKPANNNNNSNNGGSSTDATLSNSMFNGMQACYYTATVRPTHPTGFVNMRWAPSTAAKIHGRYYSNARLVVMAQNNRWCQVLDESTNTMGFMMRSFLVQE